MSLNKQLPDDAPLVLHRMANKGFDMNTVVALSNLLTGAETPANINDIRDYVSDLVEFSAQVNNAVAKAEQIVMEPLENGEEVNGYKLATSSRRSYTDTDAIISELAKEGFPAEEYLEEPKLIGLVKLDKLLKNDPAIHSRINEEYVEKKVSKPRLVRS